MNKKESSKTNNSKNIFPKWSNKVLPALLPGLFLGIGFIVFVFWYWGSPEHYNVGYQPEQPIPFSHRVHAGDLGIDCRYCHNTVETAAHAAIPAAETCMNCHDVVKKDSPHILKIRESVANNEPIDWVQVHKLPEYAVFNHSMHINAGVSCVSCHGRVDQMDKVKQVEPMSMSWCLECHRAPEKHIRPKKFVTKLDWHSEDQLKIGKYLKEKHDIYPGEDCNTCHR